LTELDEALHTARQLLDQARDRRGELSAALAKLQSDAQYMAETSQNELGLQLHELAADPAITIVAGEQLAAEDQTHREMRARLDAMGPVNMMALEEYKEAAQRPIGIN
jgi:chromosome segregation protein